MVYLKIIRRTTPRRKRKGSAVKKWLDSFHPYALITIICWSLAYVFTRIALREFSALSLGFLRYLVASVFLVIWALVTRMPPPKKKDLPWFFVAGILGFSFYISAFNIGCVYLPSAMSSVVIALTPVATALLGRVFLKERLRVFQWAAMAISFAGVAVMTALGRGFAVGGAIVWLLGSMLSLSIYNLIQRRLVRTYSAVQVTAYSILIGTVGLSFCLPDAATEWRAATLWPIVSVLFLGLFSSAIAYITWAKAFEKADKISSAGNYMFVTPLLTALLGFLINGERVDESTVAGGLMILAGLALFNFGEAAFRRLAGQTEENPPAEATASVTQEEK